MCAPHCPSTGRPSVETSGGDGSLRLAGPCERRECADLQASPPKPQPALPLNGGLACSEELPHGEGGGLASQHGRPMGSTEETLSGGGEEDASRQAARAAAEQAAALGAALTRAAQSAAAQGVEVAARAAESAAAREASSAATELLARFGVATTKAAASAQQQVGAAKAPTRALPQQLDVALEQQAAAQRAVLEATLRAASTQQAAQQLASQKGEPEGRALPRPQGSPRWRAGSAPAPAHPGVGTCLYPPTVVAQRAAGQGQQLVASRVAVQCATAVRSAACSVAVGWQPQSCPPPAPAFVTGGGPDSHTLRCLAAAPPAAAPPARPLAMAQGRAGEPSPFRGKPPPPVVGEIVEVVEVLGRRSWAWQRARVLKLHGTPPLQMEVEIEIEVEIERAKVVS